MGIIFNHVIKLSGNSSSEYGIATNRNFGVYFQTNTKCKNNQQLLQHQFEMEENRGRNVQK